MYFPSCSVTFNSMHLQPSVIPPKHNTPCHATVFCFPSSSVSFRIITRRVPILHFFLHISLHCTHRTATPTIHSPQHLLTPHSHQHLATPLSHPALRHTTLTLSPSAPRHTIHSHTSPYHSHSLSTSPRYSLSHPAPRHTTLTQHLTIPRLPSRHTTPQYFKYPPRLPTDYLATLRLSTLLPYILPRHRPLHTSCHVFPCHAKPC